jgi:hypothetical protein
MIKLLFLFILHESEYYKILKDILTALDMSCEI